ncbi:MAG: efflux transporter outer membrane subunit [Alphaproteobacteria bacterium]|nr:efflux transporter outer membrane subunit [Alphaproteobacteria bacterium]MDI9329875.1 efflux transporter outer membrane subunit [Alphaproteobacteria bacterium]
MISRMCFRGVALIALAALSACSQVPPLPDLRIEGIERFRQAPSDRGAQAMAEAVQQARATWPWWTLLGDPVLNDLQNQLLQSSPSLQVLAAQTRQAQAALAAAQASLWPSLNLNAGVTRSANQLAAVQGTSYSVSAPLTWEIDVWGRMDAQAQTALANLEAMRDDWAAGRRAAQSTLVQTYLALRTAERQIDALSRAEQAYRRSHELTQARQQAGVAAATDVAQVEAQWQGTRAQRIEVATQRAQLEHAIATLIGQPPARLYVSALDAAALARWPLTPLELPAQIPANLLDQRPDLQASKKRFEAANAQIGVSEAAFFPTVNFSVAAGYRARELGNWLSAGNQFWSVGPNMAFNLLDFGQRHAVRAQAFAARDVALANYRLAVLTAYQEVEDNLVATVQLQQQEAAQNQAWQAARRNLELTQAQYLAGTVSYLNVVVAQTSALNAESAWLDVQSRRWVALNKLMAAGLRF